MSNLSLEPASRSVVAIWGTVAVGVIAAGALVLGLVGASIGVSVGSAQVGIGWRGALALLFLVIAVRVTTERAVAHHIPQPAVATLTVSVVAYLIDPLAWDARAGFTQLVVSPGIATFVGDLALWLAAAHLGILWGLRSSDTLARRPAPSGVCQVK